MHRGKKCCDLPEGSIAESSVTVFRAWAVFAGHTDRKRGTERLELKKIAFKFVF